MAVTTVEAGEALDDLLGFVVGTGLNEVPADVLADGRRSLVDTVACVVAGTRARPVTALAAKLTRPDGPVPIPGTAWRMGAVHAALLEGMAGVWDDLDSGHRHPSSDPPVPGVHPPVHIVPAICAVAPLGRARGADAFLAYLLSYELSARIGIASRLRPGLHGHAAQPVIGAAVAVALLDGADRETLRRVVGVSASLCVMADMPAAIAGATVRNAFAGVGAMQGLLATKLVAAGVTAPSNAVGDVWGHVASDRFDPEVLVAGLGRDWETTKGYYKQHACCRWNHPALDALEDMGAHGAVSVDDVDDVLVRTFRFAASLCNDEPTTDLGSKFSIPFAVAASIVFGETTFRSFTDEALWDPRVRELARRVRVVEDPSYSAELPHRRPTTVEVRIRDGSVRVATVQGSRGDPGNRFEDDRMRHKYLDLVGARVGPERAASSLEMLERVEELDDFSEVVRVLTPPADGHR